MNNSKRADRKEEKMKKLSITEEKRINGGSGASIKELCEGFDSNYHQYHSINIKGTGTTYKNAVIDF